MRGRSLLPGASLRGLVQDQAACAVSAAQRGLGRPTLTWMCMRSAARTTSSSVYAEVGKFRCGGAPAPYTQIAHASCSLAAALAEVCSRMVYTWALLAGCLGGGMLIWDRNLEGRLGGGEAALGRRERAARVGAKRGPGHGGVAGGNLSWRGGGAALG